MLQELSKLRNLKFNFYRAEVAIAIWLYSVRYKRSYRKPNTPQTSNTNPESQKINSKTNSQTPPAGCVVEVPESVMNE